MGLHREERVECVCGVHGSVDDDSDYTGVWVQVHTHTPGRLGQSSNFWTPHETLLPLLGSPAPSLHRSVSLAFAQR